MAVSLTTDFWTDFRGSRIFVTGGTGFVGAWLLEVIQRANMTLGCAIEVAVLTRDPSRASARAPHLFQAPAISLFEGDVRSLDKEIGAIDVCIHAASEIGDPYKAAAPTEVFDTIVVGTRRILDIAARGRAKRFLLTSSGAVYGQQPANVEHVEETWPEAPSALDPRLAYGNGKRAAEWLTCASAANAGDDRDFGTIVARIFSLIGPGIPIDRHFAAGNFIGDGIGGSVINVRGDGRPLRSYLYAADLCVWLLKMLGSTSTGDAFNVGSEHAVTVADLANRVSRETGTAVRVAVGPAAGTAPQRYVPSTAKARAAFGLREFTSLDEALRKTISWTRLAMSK